MLCFFFSSFPTGAFWNFQKIPKFHPPLPPVNWTSDIGSPDFKPSYIRLITMKHALRLLLFFPHRCFSEFSQNSKNSPLLPPRIGPPKLVLPMLNQLTCVWSRWNLLCVFFSSFPISDFWLFPRIKKKSLPRTPHGPVFRITLSEF